ncbi:MAG: hypothetical protein LBS65_00360, partial [Desulfovibrio sp.]|nr:hypothetical protein [Desulfovibrio sp.]
MIAKAQSIRNILGILNSSKKYHATLSLDGSYVSFPPVGPREFIEWAMEKRSITLPQEMLDWYAVADGSKDGLAVGQQKITSLEPQLAEAQQRITSLE